MSMNTFKRFLLCSALLLCACRADAAPGTNAQPVVSGVAVSTGYQQLSVTTSVGFTPPAGTQWCNITTEAQAIRYRTDAVAPTTSVGMPLAVGATVTLRLSLAALTATRFIAQTATAVIDVDCYKDY